MKISRHPTLLAAAMISVLFMTPGCLNDPDPAPNPLIGTWKTKMPVNETDEDDVITFTFHADGKIQASEADYDWDEAFNEWVLDDIDSWDGVDDWYITDNGFIKYHFEQTRSGDLDVFEGWFKYEITGNTMVLRYAAVHTGSSTTLVGTWEMSTLRDSANVVKTRTSTMVFASNGTMTRQYSGSSVGPDVYSYTDHGSYYVTARTGSSSRDTVHYQIGGSKLYTWYMNPEYDLILTKQ